MTRAFHRTAFATTALAALIVSPGLARADVTPEDVWAQFESYLSSFGYETTMQPVKEGATLRVPDVTLSVPMPADPATGAEGGSMTVSMGEMSLTDRGDGTVAVEMPASMPLRIASEGMEKGNFTVRGRLLSEGYDMIASGNPGDITYDFTMGKMTMQVDEIDGTDGITRTPDALMMVMEGGAGSSHIKTGDGPTAVDQTFTLAKLTYKIDAENIEADKPGHFKMEGVAEGLTSEAAGTFPAAFDPAALSAALADGYAFSADMAYTTGRSNLDFSDPEQSFKMSTTSQGGSFKVGMGDTGLVYDVMAKGLTFSIEGSEIPFPIASTMGAFGMGIDMPVMKKDEDQPFSASITLTDVAVPEPLWMMIDAGGQLPHDPLTVELKTSGQARLFTNIFDEKAMAELAKTDEAPGEVSRVNIDQLLVKAGGATIAATGGFDIDNTMTNPMDPDMPAMAGSIDLQLTGVTGLLGKLSQMGLIPMPQTMMATGMIQQLGKPGNGPDDYTAVIEVAKEGALTINGAPFPPQ